LRHSSIRIVTAFLCLLFAVAAWWLSPHFSPAFAQNQTQPAPAIKPVSASIPTNPSISSPLIAAPGTEIYTAKRGEAIPTIARRYLGKTSYLTSSELAEAIRQTNGNRTGNILKANENIVIPGILPAPITEKPIPVAKDLEVRAVYLTGVMAGSDHGLRIIRHWREVGGNAVVFDIKDSDGSVTIPFEHPLLGKHNVYLHDVPKFVHFLHQQNMHAIARIAIFRDERLVVEHPELAVKSRRTGQPWRENGKLVWTDPSNPKVQDYDIALARHVAELGVDEIQFDYVRFPAEGDQKDALFTFQTEHPEAPEAASNQDPSANKSPCGDSRPGRPAEAKQAGTSTNAGSNEAANPTSAPAAKGRKKRITCNAGAKTPTGPQRSDVITAFLKKAYAEIHPTGALFSLDVFGVMAWQRPVDLSHTGQDIVGMARYCDVLSPMIYPSHFFGMDNIARPGDAPEHFIAESMDRFELITHPDGNKTSGVVIRPWLQAFHWRTKTYSPEYIKIQVATAKEKGGIGFLFWNAANDYSKPFTAMPEMRAASMKPGATEKDKFFRGDELPGATPVRAALIPAN
jgi:hypothetical protein